MPAEANVETVGEIVDKFADERDDFEDWCQGIGPVGEQIYALLCERGDWTMRGDIYQAIPGDRLDLKKALEALSYHGLVREDKKRGFRVGAEMFRAWFEEYRLPNVLDPDGDKLKLEEIEPGAAGAKAYEECVYEMLCRFFAGQLSHPQRESKTVYGTERRDIIFYNDSSHKFWQMLGERYAATNIVFECKNTKMLKLEHVNQIVQYLGQPLGSFGVIISRLSPGKNLRSKAIAAYNSDKKVVLFLSDQDLGEMADLYARGEDPTRVIEDKYVEFIRAVQ